MTNYDYNEALKNDIKDYIKWEINLDEWEADQLYDELNDTLWTVDSVTGNGSGSYTFNSYKAKEYVIGNMDLCTEALREFCVDAETIADKFLNENWEYFDVTIRCYLLAEAIHDIIGELVADDLLAGKGW